MLVRDCVHCYSHKGLNIVVDGNSGAVHLLDDVAFTIVSEIKDGRELTDFEPSEALEEVTFLIDEGVLFSPDLTEVPEPQTSVVKALCLNIAHDCNIRCEYCFAHEGDFGGKRELMSLEVAKQAVDFLLNASGPRVQCEIDFFGGEPLMNFDVVKETVKYGKERSQELGKVLRFTLTTNGIALNDEIIDFVNNEMYNVVLSIDGRKEVNDSMRRTYSGVGSVYETIIPKYRELVSKRGPKSYYVRGTFTRNNLDFSNDVLHLVDQGFYEVSMEPVVADEDERYALTENELPAILQEYERLADAFLASKKQNKPFNFFHFNVELKKGPCIYKRILGCGAGHEYLAVAPDGNLYPCHQFVGQDEYVIGSVYEGIKKTDLKDQFKNSHVLNKQTCKTCWAKYFCSGGCHANNIKFSGSINEPYEVSCIMERKRLECSFYIQAALSLEE
ncbi:MAG: thioether cross-link-forming SCIFF peptide maturase [Firmicutes bacterium]|nr:thioether cross-link-forming SCIFF peptide maturase [Bacillota bacterium]